MFIPVRTRSHDELDDLRALATLGVSPRKMGKAAPRYKTKRDRPTVTMTPAQRLYTRARDMADRCFPLGQSLSLLGGTCARIRDAANWSEVLVADCQRHLLSAGQCEWIVDHLAIAREAMCHIEGMPRLGDLPATAAHVVATLRNLDHAIALCQSFARYHDRGPYDRSRHLCDTPSDPDNG